MSNEMKESETLLNEEIKIREKYGSVVIPLHLCRHYGDLRAKEAVKELHSFARSQAIEFAEWCIIEGFYYYPSLKAWMEDPSDLNKYSSSEIYDLFLAEQAKQKEGGII